MVCTCLSPWHDIPLHLGDGVFNFVVKIPKESSVKIEFATYKPSHRSSRTQRRGIFDTSVGFAFSGMSARALYDLFLPSPFQGLQFFTKI